MFFFVKNNAPHYQSLTKKLEKVFGIMEIISYYCTVMIETHLKLKTKMTNLETQLEQLVEQFGIEAVMSSIKNQHADKVYLPQWYYQNHLEDMGFEFDEEYFTMCAFDEFMSDASIINMIDQTLAYDYVCEWEEYKENNS